MPLTTNAAIQSTALFIFARWVISDAHAKIDTILSVLVKMAWVSGQQLQRGKYTIRDIIGMGRFGVTYRAETTDGMAVVIKTPNDEAMHRPDFEQLQQQFVKEAFKLARCEHPHIVKVKEPFQEDGIWCIPMEYVAGVTLDKRDRRLLPEDEALRYVRQIGDALTVVHQNQLLHRDVRPENIMLRIRSGQSEAVLIDFGLARDFDQPMTQTRTNEIAAGFAPLELYSSQANRGAYTDIYSLGATLYTLIAGAIPPSAEERKLRGTSLNLPDNINNVTRRAIRWAMELEAKDRPQSVPTWLEALPQNGNSSICQPTSVSSGDAPKKQWEVWQLIFAGIAAIGALFAGFEGIAALVEAIKPDTPPSPTPTQTQTP